GPIDSLATRNASSLTASPPRPSPATSRGTSPSPAPTASRSVGGRATRASNAGKCTSRHGLTHRGQGPPAGRRYGAPDRVRLRRARFWPTAAGKGPGYQGEGSLPVVLACFRRALTNRDPVENPPPVPEGVPARALRRSFFRDVPWRWRDVLFCFAPSVLSRQ